MDIGDLAFNYTLCIEAVLGLGDLTGLTVTNEADPLCYEVSTYTYILCMWEGEEVGVCVGRAQMVGVWVHIIYS